MQMGAPMMDVEDSTSINQRVASVNHDYDFSMPAKKPQLYRKLTTGIRFKSHFNENGRYSELRSAHNHFKRRSDEPNLRRHNNGTTNSVLFFVIPFGFAFLKYK